MQSQNPSSLPIGEDRATAAILAWGCADGVPPSRCATGVPTEAGQYRCSSPGCRARAVSA